MPGGVRVERLLAFDLLLLCWNDATGRVRTSCSFGMATGIGGALLLDGVLAGVVTVEDGRVQATGVRADDPLVDEVIDEASGRRRAPKAKALVGRLGSGRRVKALRARMVREGWLEERRERVLGVIPVTRRPPADPAAAEALRERIRGLLTGGLAPEDAEEREVVLASLAGAVALEALVPRGQRREARRRAEQFRDGAGVSEAVSAAVQEAQIAVIGAVAGAAAAGGASG